MGFNLSAWCPAPQIVLNFTFFLGALGLNICLNFNCHVIESKISLLVHPYECYLLLSAILVYFGYQCFVFKRSYQIAETLKNNCIYFIRRMLSRGIDPFKIH